MSHNESLRLRGGTLSGWEVIRKEIMKMRRQLNRLAKYKPLPNGVSKIIVGAKVRSLSNQHASTKLPDDVHQLMVYLGDRLDERA